MLFSRDSIRLLNHNHTMHTRMQYAGRNYAAVHKIAIGI